MAQLRRLALVLLAIAVLNAPAATASLKQPNTVVRAPNPSSDRAWKTAVDVSTPRLRGLLGTKSAQCYSVCATCLCDKNEDLHCCKNECSATFEGCVAGNIYTLCRTSRPVNACCTG